MGRWELVDGQVTIVEDLVLRPALPWTPTVHDLLGRLRAEGLECVPEPVGIDDGIEAVRLIPGDSGDEAWPHQVADAGVRSAGELLRLVHDATEAYRPPPDARWAFPAVPGSTVVTHGDPGPWNFVWRDGVAVALIDWDQACPGPALDDVAYAGAAFAPCRPDEFACEQLRFPGPPDRAARLRALAEGYRLGGTAGLVDRVVDRQQAGVDRIVQLAERGLRPWSDWVLDGHLDELRGRVRWTRSHRHLLE